MISADNLVLHVADVAVNRIANRRERGLFARSFRRCMFLGLLRRAIAEGAVEMMTKTQKIHARARFSRSRGNCSMFAIHLHVEGKRRVRGRVSGKNNRETHL